MLCTCTSSLQETKLQSETCVDSYIHPLRSGSEIISSDCIHKQRVLLPNVMNMASIFMTIIPKHIGRARGWQRVRAQSSPPVVAEIKLQGGGEGLL